MPQQLVKQILRFLFQKHVSVGFALIYTAFIAEPRLHVTHVDKVSAEFTV